MAAKIGLKITANTEEFKTQLDKVQEAYKQLIIEIERLNSIKMSVEYTDG